MKKILMEHRRLIFTTLSAQVLMNIILMCGTVLNQRLIDAVLSRNMADALGTVCLRFGWIIFEVGGIIFSQAIEATCSASMVKKIRERLFDSILNQNMSDIISNQSSDYISQMTNDMNTFKNRFLGVFFLVSTCLINIIVTAVLMLIYQPIIAVISIGVSIIMVTVPMITSKKMIKHEQVRTNTLAAFTGGIQDIFEGLEVILNYNLAGSMKKRFDKINSEMSCADRNVEIYTAYTNSLGQSFGTLADILMLMMCAYFVASGNMTAGMLAIFITLKSNFSTNLTMILQTIPVLKGMEPVIAKIMPKDRTEEVDNLTVPTFNSAIRIQNLGFGYSEEKKIYEDFNCKIDKGKKYAIIGKNGTGKTTLVRLIAGYFLNYSGQIFYDDKELHSVDRKKLNNIVNIVNQNTYLFNDTIRENILLGNEFSDDELDRVTDICGLNKITGGLDTGVGEKGCLLSGGQRQRVAIARALIRKTPLLILDEGTSAIDTVGANEIEKIILNNPSMTLIVITHNQSKENLDKYDEVIRIGEVIGEYQ